MALYKAIKQEDGVTTCYHRIIYLMQMVNKRTSIAVVSYVDSNSRTAEQNSTIAQPYMKSVTYETDYDETMTISDAYDYLKTLPDFEGANDV